MEATGFLVWWILSERLAWDDEKSVRNRILIVDDEADIREPLAEYLTRNELLVSMADSAVNADERNLMSGDGVNVPLGEAEFRLLMAFVMRPRQVLSRSQLLDMADAREADPFDRSIDNRVVRLRRKIEVDPANPALIKTVRGGGYVFTADVRQAP